MLKPDAKLRPLAYARGSVLLAASTDPVELLES
jgi:hypothetical protein